jgi:hypothetical protein
VTKNLHDKWNQTQESTAQLQGEMEKSGVEGDQHGDKQQW